MALVLPLGRGSERRAVSSRVRHRDDERTGASATGPRQDSLTRPAAPGPARPGIRPPRHTIDLMRFAKGHGTGNDFVILPDPDGRLDLTPELVARICDRRTGLGADGVLRVIRAKAAADIADAE